MFSLDTRKLKADSGVGELANSINDVKLFHPLLNVGEGIKFAQDVQHEGFIYFAYSFWCLDVTVKVAKKYPIDNLKADIRTNVMGMVRSKLWVERTDARESVSDSISEYLLNS